MKPSILASVAAALCASAWSQTVTKVELAKDRANKPGEIVKAFSTSDNPLHFVVHLKPLDKPATLMAILTAVHAGKHDNFEVATTNVAAKKGTQSIDFRFRIHPPWPIGTYRIEIKAGERLLKDLEFEIK
ncbi:MAG TPA: hypothetical protein VG820_04765 [Fimbriimonadaceae bacterium]|nr:hypothetical protein [Fimbriimonadaceae bacterium]